MFGTPSLLETQLIWNASSLCLSMIGQAPDVISVCSLQISLESLTKKLIFATRKSGTSCVLTISDSNMGMYYCAAIDYEHMIFRSGVFLMHQDSRTQHVVEQPVSESVQPGDSVSLNCTIHTETCAGEHSVYWFRHGSGESHPGIIYSHGDRSDQCEKSPEDGSPTQSCVYNLPKRNLSLSDAGTYYCAVASCGEILFGNGTKLDVEVHVRAGTEPSAIQQESGLMSANVVDTATFQRFYEGDVAMHFSWYKQPLGEKPQLISTICKYDKAPTYYHEFKGNPRFSVQSGQGINHLSISDMKSSDSATYYYSGCNSKTVVEQSVSDSVQPGDSENTVSIGSDMAQENPIQELFTLVETGVISERRALRLGLLHRAVSTTSPRGTSASLMLGLMWGDIVCNGTKLDIQGGDVQVVTEADMRILVLFSIIRTGFLLCCLTIFFIIYLVRK
ncbi:unnamed protein product, partial [Coregonus sp. 'balchen']